jgi:hypothetical protein
VKRALGLTLLLVLAPATTANAQLRREALVVFLEGVSYERLLRTSDMGSILAAGGIGIMTTPGGAVPATETRRMIARRLGSRGWRVVPGAFDARGRLSLNATARTLLDEIGRSGPAELMVVVVSLAPSDEMRSRGENVTPVVVASGTTNELLTAKGPTSGLTSDTTRRSGVVASVDVPKTIRNFLGLPVSEELPGSPIRVEGEPPTELHQRYLEYRRVVVPTGVVVLAFTLLALLVALVVLFTGRGSPGVVRAVAVWGVVGVSLQVGLLAGSWLPTFEPWVVALTVGGVGFLVAAAALWWGRGTLVRVPAAVAVLALAFLLVDALLGWRSLLTPLLGGSALDGVRFYGLGNPYAGVVLAGSVLAAALIPPPVGVALMLAAALFAGLPFLGADLGGGITLFVVAGLWYGLRGWRSARAGVLWAAAGGLAGAVLLVVAHRFLPPEQTHVTRAVEASGGLAGVVDVFLDRLRLNLEVTAATPAIWPALAGLVLALYVAVARPGPFRYPLERFEAWRLGAVVLAIGAMLGYVLNDTYGMASVSFIYLALALVYPALAVRWTHD